MSPDFLLASLYSESSISRVAHSALPDAPVRSHVERRMQFRRSSTSRQRWSLRARWPGRVDYTPVS